MDSTEPIPAIYRHGDEHSAWRGLHDLPQAEIHPTGPVVPVTLQVDGRIFSADALPWLDDQADGLVAVLLEAPMTRIGADELLVALAEDGHPIARDTLESTLRRATRGNDQDCVMELDAQALWTWACRERPAAVHQARGLVRSARVA